MSSRKTSPPRGRAGSASAPVGAPKRGPAAVPERGPAGGTVGGSALRVGSEERLATVRADRLKGPVARRKELHLGACEAPQARRTVARKPGE